MKYEEEMRRALDTETSCFIFASAGSGKTSVLVNRFIKSLFQGLKPQEILCVTFTNAAVFEMQSRISEILKNLYINDDKYTAKFLENTIGLEEVTEDEIRRAEGLFFEFQDALPKLKILTIHAFCQSLLQQFTLEVGILPNFSILDTGEANALMRKAKEETLSQIPENLLNSLARKISVHTFEDFINQIPQMIDNFMTIFCSYASIDEYEEFLRRKFCLRDDIEYSDIQKKFIEKFNEGGNLEEIFLTQNGEIRKKVLSSDDETLKEIAEIVHINNQNKRKKSIIEKTCSFLKVVRSVLQRYESLKKNENVLDFTDVLHMTEILLTKSCAKEFITSKICSQIKSVMIDEAQDLSSTQWRLITLLVDGIFSDTGSNKVIFVVGDIKQSIYRFQGANCKLFYKFYEYCREILVHLEKGINTVYLNTCYRSLPEILKNVDQVFSGEIAKFAFEQDLISYMPHVTHRIKNDDVIHHSGFAMIEINDESNAIAQIVEHIAGQRSENILLLTRTRNEFIANLTKKLLDAGLNVAPSDRIKLIDNLLVMDILAIVDICIDDKNDYALACILKSPYFFAEPLTNEELLPICYNRTTTVIENLKRFYPDKYEQIAEVKKHYNSSAAIKFFYYLTSVVRRFSRSDDDVIEAFMDSVLKFVSKKSNKISEFLDYFRSCDVFVYSKNTSKDQIRISTIHGAKGSEADVVYLLNFPLKADKAKMKMIFVESTDLSTKNVSPLFFIRPSKNDSFQEIDEMIESEI
ncbi:MAG: UvrD-helicase domain-containing protein, partial [Holosporales bacterium]|nr:UvrD-helicase domain-containing protein [Holosporales bacterium]